MSEKKGLAELIRENLIASFVGIPAAILVAWILLDGRFAPPQPTPLAVITETPTVFLPTDTPTIIPSEIPNEPSATATQTPTYPLPTETITISPIPPIETQTPAITQSNTERVVHFDVNSYVRIKMDIPFGWVNFRDSPNGIILETLKLGTILQITGEPEGIWWPVRRLPNAEEGWIGEISDEGIPLFEEFAYLEYVNIQIGQNVQVVETSKYGSLNLRIVPNGSIIDRLEEGEIVMVVDGPSSGAWWKVIRSSDGVTGWVAAVDNDGEILIIPSN